MPYQTDDIALIRKAQLGDRDSLNHLAVAARVRLHEYVLRLTLNEDLTQDIVQETMLEMLRIFDKLRKTETFWPWLYGIAINKTRNHYGKQWRRRTRNFSEAGYEPDRTSEHDTLSDVVTAELKHIVVRCVGQLAPHQRAVLTMRCYDHLSYAQIAQLLDCSEIGARATFYRAKKCLARRLSAHGLGKGSLLLALVAFGKLTATSEATAAQVAVTSATLQVGPTAALLAAITEPTSLLVLTAAVGIALGSATLDTEPGDSVIGVQRGPTSALASLSLPADTAQQQEWWYYFPERNSNVVMQRLLHSDDGNGTPTCHVLQNQFANYQLDPDRNRVHITNYRAWKPDLSVMRLPTDSPDLSDFIARVEGQPSDMELTGGSRSRLLVICNQQSERGARIWRIDRHANVLEEEYFQVSWPERTAVLDNRDTMHKRGWTYFQVAGHLGDRTVSGVGRLPFVYAHVHQHYPWLKLRLGDGTTLVDTPGGARLYDRAGHISAECRGGSFFQGLPRPWMGLHCIDTIRRDAASEGLKFETVTEDEETVTVTVQTAEQTLAYTVNMRADVIEAITMTAPGGQASSSGVLEFTYLQDLATTTDARFSTPAEIRPTAVPRREIGILWPAELTLAH